MTDKKTNLYPKTYEEERDRELEIEHSEQECDYTNHFDSNFA